MHYGIGKDNRGNSRENDKDDGTYADREDKKGFDCIDSTILRPLKGIPIIEFQLIMIHVQFLSASRVRQNLCA